MGRKMPARATEGLTPVEAKVLDFIKEYRQLHPYCPSLREIERAFNWKSPAVVQSVLNRLKAKGKVNWIEGSPRTLHELE